MKDESKVSSQELRAILPYRKLKSLSFRVKRRDLKIKLRGTPFASRPPAAKNANRSKAALRRTRDQDGKFLDVPISSAPKKKMALVAF